jgi:hypothetical protein
MEENRTAQHQLFGISRDITEVPANFLSPGDEILRLTAQNCDYKRRLMNK